MDGRSISGCRGKRLVLTDVAFAIDLLAEQFADRSRVTRDGVEEE